MSVYPLSRDLEELLRAKKFPLRVYYGPERMHREGYPDNAIVAERDRGANAALTAPRGVQRNPRKEAQRALAAQLHIYARASKAGAHIGDHEERCEKFVDAVLIALRHWAVATRAVSADSVNLPISESRYLSADERLQLARVHYPGADSKVFQAIEQWPGVVYRIKFTVPRALLDLDYAGDGAPEGAIGSIASRTDVTGPAHATPAVGCGDP